MSSFKAESYCDVSNPNTNFEGLYSHDRGSKLVVIRDNLITDEIVAEERAKAELITGGYAERWLYLKTEYTPKLKQNDIIMFNGKKWIVKEITISYTPPKLTQSIKGLRYE